MPWEETQTEITSGHRSPSEFEEETQKTVPLNSKDGVRATTRFGIGVLRSNAIAKLTDISQTLTSSPA